MKASRVMTRQVVCILPATSLGRAHELMVEYRVRHLPVTEDGRLCGVISDRDLLVRAHREPDGRLVFPESVAAEAMTRVPISCRPTETVSTLAGLMITHRIDCVPITDSQNHLVGIVTSMDLVELLREPDQVSNVLPFVFNLRKPDELAA